MGYMLIENYERYMLRVNNDLTITDKLAVKLDLNVKRTNSHLPVYDPLSSMRMIPAIYAAVWSDGRIAEGKSGGNPIWFNVGGRQFRSLVYNVGGEIITRL